ncbi:heavy-metal-associated domain-containing protein [Adhaeribacter aquaticus]|uniref:heavy-metal-associated domain-containing protein n=1 Tax=Adhaeribacter aquaticus TaxID=299567 RepID=UPI000416D96F|nr:hypothetical protein [Adhaeribacter aquaticus]
MEILKFKTNIEDQESVAKVGSFLDHQEGINKWDVDTNSEDKILSISGSNINPQKIENTIQQAGYQAEMIRVTGISGEDL